MKTATISDISQEDFDSAVQTVIAGIKSSDPKLDTRVGSVLRSLLVNPEARITATTAKQIDYVRQSTSLKSLAAAKQAGEDIDIEDINAILSNFNLRSTSGTKARGVAKIQVESGTQVYTIAQGISFSTTDGLSYTALKTCVAAQSNTATNSVNTPLYRGAEGYFFLVPVEATESGAEYNIPQGTALTVSTSLFTLVSVEAYKSFDGGSDIADLNETIDKIPTGLAIRGFVNKTACEGMLRDKFDTGPNPILACSTVGYGNGAQRRDKHNIFGVGVGGRVDLYIRNFGDLSTEVGTVIGTRIGETKDYTLTVRPEQFPGSYWVKNLSCISEVNSPLSFSCSRACFGIENTWHDFDVSKNPAEAFNTIWHGLNVQAKEVPPDSRGEWPAERQFRVEVYCLPQAAELQAFVDEDSVRNVSTDVVVRCPIICNVTVSASVVYDINKPMDENYAKYEIRKYINSLGFVKELTRSEIVHVLKNCGALSVHLNKTDMLYGTLYDAFGNKHTLSGDALRLGGWVDAAAMLTPDTTIFAVEPENIQLTLIPNK